MARLVMAGATVLAGGTTLMPMLNTHASAPLELVSLRRAGLSGVQVSGTTVTIGAATTLAQIEHDDRLTLLNRVVRSIASVPVRSLATVGGNLFAAQPHGDLAVALVALGAQATILDDDGFHTVAVEHVGHGQHKGLVTSITFDLPEADSFKYVKAARRRFNSAAIVTVAAVVTEFDRVVASARVAFGGLGAEVVHATSAADALVGRPLDKAAVDAAVEAVRGELSPVDDAYASAWYRARVFPVHLRRALLGL